MSDTFRIAVVAHIKHGALYEAIRKKGWNQSEAAKFLDITPTQMGTLLNLKARPPFIFSAQKRHKTKVRKLQEKLMELTGLSVYDLFPEEVMTKEFLSRPKKFAGVRDVPLQVLLDSGAMPHLLPAPDEALLQKEVDEEVLHLLDELPPQQRAAVKGRYWEGKPIETMAEETGTSPSNVSALSLTGLRRLHEKANALRVAEQERPWLHRDIFKKSIPT